MAICGACMINSCAQKENAATKTGTFTVSFEATRGGTTEFVNPYTKGLDVQTSETGEKISGTWVAGETVLVMTSPITPADYATAKPEDIMKQVGILTATTSGPVTTLTGQLTGTFRVGQNLALMYQHRPDLVYDYTGQDGSIETIASKYDYAQSNYIISSINGSSIVGSYAPYFHGYQAIVKFILKDEAGDPIKASSLEISTTGGASHFVTKFEPLKVDAAKMIEYMQSVPSSPHMPIDNPYLACQSTGAIVINPTAPSDVIYAALTGDVNGTGIMFGVSNATVSLKATVGSDTYIYEKEAVSFNCDNFYIVEVNMKKQ